MSEQDEYSLTFRERAMIDAISDSVIEKMRLKFPNLGDRNNISWADFLYSLAKGSAAMILGFVALAALWAVVQYLKAGAPTLGAH